MSDVAYASAEEHRVAALVLVYYATSMVVGEGLKQLMTAIVEGTSSYTTDESFRPPPTWSTCERELVGNTRAWLERASPDDKSGTVTPVIHVAAHTYSIFTTTKGIYFWRRRLCAPLKGTPVAPFLAPSWDSKTKKTRLVLMLPHLARMVLAEFKDMDRLLQAAVDIMPMEAATAPSPSKADVKRQRAELVVELAEAEVELAETQQPLDAEVKF